MAQTIRNVIRSSRFLILMLLLFAGIIVVVFTRPKVSRANSAPARRHLNAQGNPATLSATTFVVNTTSDTLLAGACVAATPGQCSLREAIVEANANLGADTIDASGVTGTINLTGVLPDISDDVIINGPGASLLTVRRDTGGDYRIFNVMTAGTVTFFGLTIANGKASQGGGIASLIGGTVNVVNSNVSGNVGGSGAGGGGIQFQGTLNVINTTVSGNSCPTICGGGGIAGGNNLTVFNSTISGNFANHGGGMVALGTVNISNSTISGNSVTDFGGGFDTGYSTVNITNTTISGNYGAYAGGAIGSGTRAS